MFAGRQGLGQEKNLVVTLDREIRPIRLDADMVAELAIARATYDRRAGRFDVTFEVAHHAHARSASPAHWSEMAEVAVLTRPLVARRDVCASRDVVVERRPKSDVGADAAVETPDPVVGLAARQALPAGRIVRQADFIKPDLVKRDEPVTLVFEAPGLTLTTRGKALDTGAEGDVVNVLNLQSKRTIQGHVSGPGRITVSSSGSRITEPAVAAVSDRVRAE